METNASTAFDFHNYEITYQDINSVTTFEAHTFILQWQPVFTPKTHSTQEEFPAQTFPVYDVLHVSSLM